MREWIAAVGARTAFIKPGSSWENGTCESFNSKLRDELRNGEIFSSLAEAEIVIVGWRQHFKHGRHPVVRLSCVAADTVVERPTLWIPSNPLVIS